MLEAAAPALSAAAQGSRIACRYCNSESARLVARATRSVGGQLKPRCRHKARNAKQRASFDSLVRCRGCRGRWVTSEFGHSRPPNPQIAEGEGEGE